MNNQTLALRLSRNDARGTSTADQAEGGTLRGRDVVPAKGSKVSWLLRSESGGDLAAIQCRTPVDEQRAIAELIAQTVQNYTQGSLIGRVVWTAAATMGLVSDAARSGAFLANDAFWAMDTAAESLAGFTAEKLNTLLEVPVLGEAASTAASYGAYRIGATVAMRFSTTLAWYMMTNVAPALFVGPLAPMATVLGTFGPSVAWLLYGMELRNHIENATGLLAAGTLALPALTKKYRQYFGSTEEGKLKVELAKVLLERKFSEQVNIDHIETFNALSTEDKRAFIDQLKSKNPE